MSTHTRCCTDSANEQSSGNLSTECHMYQCHMHHNVTCITMSHVSMSHASQCHMYQCHMYHNVTCITMSHVSLSMSHVSQCHMYCIQLCIIAVILNQFLSYYKRKTMTSNNSIINNGQNSMHPSSAYTHISLNTFL